MADSKTAPDSFREAALDSLPAVVQHLMELLPGDDERWTDLAARYVALEKDLGEDAFNALDATHHFFGRLALMVTSSTVGAARTIYETVPDVPVAFAPALKDGLWARYRLDHNDVDRGGTLYELGGALYRLIPHLGPDSGVLWSNVVGVFLRAIQAYIDAGTPAQAVAPATMFTALSNEIGQQGDQTNMLQAGLEWGQRILQLQTSSPDDVTGCVMVASNLMNTCTELAAKVPARAEGHLRDAIRFAGMAERWLDAKSWAPEDAPFHTRVYRAAAGVHYRLAQLQFDTFATSVDAIHRLCRKHLDLAASRRDPELRVAARQLAGDMENKLRLLRPQWTGTFQPAESDGQAEDAFDVAAWQVTGTKLAAHVESCQGADRERCVEQALDECYAPLALALQAVLDETGLNHHACTLLMAVCSLGSDRLAPLHARIIAQGLAARAAGETHDAIRWRQKMLAPTSLRARVFERIFTLEAFSRALARSAAGKDLDIRRRLAARNRLLLREVLRGGRYVEPKNIPNTQAIDVAQLLFKWLPGRFGVAGLHAYSGADVIPDDIARPLQSVFQPRPTTREPRVRPLDDRPGPRNAPLLPNLIPSDEDVETSAASVPGGKGPLGAYVTTHPNASDEELSGTTVDLDGQVGILGDVIGRGRDKVAYKLLDPQRGTDLIDQRTGRTVIATLRRTKTDGGQDARAVTTSTDTADLEITSTAAAGDVTDAELLPYMHLFTDGALESTLSFLLDNPPHWTDMIESLVAHRFVRRETIPGLRNVFLRFLPELASALANVGAPSSAGIDTKFLDVYRHLAAELNRMVATGRAAAASALIVVERQNIARAIDMAMMRTDRHLTASLAELLRFPDQVQGAANRPNQILRRVDDWLAQPQLETVLDQAQIVRIQNDAQERFSRGDADGAIAMLEDLVRRTHTTAVADAKDSLFALGVTLYSLGRLYADAGRPNEALPPFKRAVDLFHRLDEPAAQSNLLQVQLRMATIYRDTGHLDEALRLSREAIEIARRSGHTENQLDAVIHAAGTLLLAHQPSEARRLLEEATRLITEKTSRRYVSYLHAKAVAWMDTGEAEQALAILEEASTIQQTLGGGDDQLAILNARGLIEHRLGRLDDAERTFEASRALSQDRSDVRAAAIPTLNLARLYKSRAEAAGVPSERERLYRRALAYASESRALGVAARDLTMAIDAAGEMAVMHRSLGEIPESRAVSLERLALRQDLGRGDLYRDYRFLADLARDAGLVAEADEWADKTDELLTGIAMGRIRAKGGFGSLQPVLQDLAAATVNARLHGRGIDDDRRHVLEELGKYGPPFSTLTNVLIEIAAGKPLRPIPGWMPAEIAEIIEAAQRELRGEPT